MAVYPASIIAYTTKTNKVDLVDAAHINTLQTEQVALQTELGKDPAGSFTDLVTRLAHIQDVDGAVAKGTTFPSSGLVDGQALYRTDDDVLYIYNGSTWDAQGQSLSNVIFCFGVGGDYAVNSYGAVIDDSLVPASSEIQKLSWANATTTNRNIIKSRWTKISGITTITCYARAWVQTSGAAIITVNIGGQTGTVTGATNQLTPEELNFTVDVSSLTPGTNYALDIGLKHSAAGGPLALLDSIIGIAS
jgi:hypothetical protein